MPSIEKIRARTWQFLSPSVAAAAGLSLQELQAFVGGSLHPTSEQLERLARRMGMKP